MSRWAAVLLAATIAAPAWSAGREAGRFDVSDALGFARGLKVSAPRTVVVRDLNVLRYDCRLGVEVTYAPGPDLSLPFIPLPRGTVPVESWPGFTTARLGPMRFGPDLEAIRKELEALDDNSLRLRRDIVIMITTANDAMGACEQLAIKADDHLRDRAYAKLLRTMRDVAGQLDAAIRVWPSDSVESLRQGGERLKTRLAFFVPTRKEEEAARNQLETRLKDIVTRIETILSASQSALDHAVSLRKMRAWRDLLGTLDDSTDFTRTVAVDARTHFLFHVESKVELVRRDRLAKPDTAPEKETIVTVVSPSPLSVSAGFGVSWADEAEFASVPTLTTIADTTTGGTKVVTVNSVGLLRESYRHPIPAILVNLRGPGIMEWSIGAATDKTSGGVEFEYLLGAGLAIRRSVVITGGVHFSRQQRLEGGFSRNAVIPSGTGSLPIRKIWKGAPMLVITFRVR